MSQADGGPRVIRSETQATIDRGRERTKLGPFGWDIEFEVEADAGPKRELGRLKAQVEQQPR